MCCESKPVVPKSRHAGMLMTIMKQCTYWPQVRSHCIFDKLPIHLLKYQGEKINQLPGFPFSSICSQNYCSQEIFTKSNSLQNQFIHFNAFQYQVSVDYILEKWYELLNVIILLWCGSNQMWCESYQICYESYQIWYESYRMQCESYQTWPFDWELLNEIWVL